MQYLVLGAKARAAIAGEYNVTCDHVRDVAPLVLRHRIMTNFHGEAEGMTAGQGGQASYSTRSARRGARITDDPLGVLRGRLAAGQVALTMPVPERTRRRP